MNNVLAEALAAIILYEYINRARSFVKRAKRRPRALSRAKTAYMRALRQGFNPISSNRFP